MNGIIGLALLLPNVFIFIFLGIGMINNRDKESAMGYRSKKSRASDEAWRYANSKAGKLMALSGVVALVGQIIFTILSFNYRSAVIEGLSISGGNIIIVIGLIITIVSVEYGLVKNYPLK